MKSSASSVRSLGQLLEQQPATAPSCLVGPGLLPAQGILFIGGEPKVGKSLLVPQSTASGTMDFRLLETVRIYALEKTIKREGGMREATLHYEHSGHGQSPWCSAAKPDLELEPFNLFGNAAL